MYCVQAVKLKVYTLIFMNPGLFPYNETRAQRSHRSKTRNRIYQNSTKFEIRKGAQNRNLSGPLSHSDQ